MIVCDFCHAPLPDSESKKTVGVVPSVSQQEIHVCGKCLAILNRGIHDLVLKQKLQTRKGEVKRTK